jgi:RNA polymerase sigma-70 factor, ECF subfamily
VAVFGAERGQLVVEHRSTGFVERLKARETLAWTELFEGHYRLVYRTTLALVGRPAVAEDITAQVFLEAFEGIDRYRDRGRPLSSWLLTIARHRSLDWLRKKRREMETLEFGVEADVADGDATSPAPAREALELLAQLTPDQREVVALRFVEGYAIDEVAQITGRSPGAVKSLQHRALNNLRHILQPRTTES